MVATAESILAAKDITESVVKVEPWGDVRIRSMNGREFDDFMSYALEHKSDVRGTRVRLVIACAIGADGQRLFKDTDAEKLGLKSARALGELADAIAELNGLGRPEDAEKNS